MQKAPITKVELPLKHNAIQMTLFDDTLVEIQKDNVRYILGRNAVRAQEIINSRESKIASIETHIPHALHFIFDLSIFDLNLAIFEPYFIQYGVV